jgi:HEPN domain
MPNDPQQIANTGKSFLIAADRCFEKRQLPGAQVQVPIVPAVVCTAFGIELCLKAIISFEGGKATGHELLKLFIKLSTQSKTVLAAALSLSEYDLRQKIGAISSAFIDWRYIYEKSSTTIDAEFLCRFAHEVRLLLETMANPSPQPTASSGP